MTPTAIEWARNNDGSKGETWNPVTGCTKVSAGCDHCYAERITNRFGGKGAFDTIVLHPERMDAPLRRRKPTTYFVNSMSDLFHADVPRSFIAECFAIMAITPQHTYQILTKRPGRARLLLSDDSFTDLVDEHRLAREPLSFQLCDWPRPNIWLGVSCEDQETADKRVPVLLDTPAAVRFLSCEPLLGPIRLHFPGPPQHDIFDGRDVEHDTGNSVDWVIVGGESGPGARPMAPDWARSLRDQCDDADVPFFFKQWGEWVPLADLPPEQTVGEPEERLCGQRYMWRVGKKKAGRELDGRTWDQMPERRA